MELYFTVNGVALQPSGGGAVPRPVPELRGPLRRVRVPEGGLRAATVRGAGGSGALSEMRPSWPPRKSWMRMSEALCRSMTPPARRQPAPPANLEDQARGVGGHRRQLVAPDERCGIVREQKRGAEEGDALEIERDVGESAAEERGA